MQLRCANCLQAASTRAPSCTRGESLPQQRHARRHIAPTLTDSTAPSSSGVVDEGRKQSNMSSSCCSMCQFLKCAVLFVGPALVAIFVHDETSRGEWRIIFFITAVALALVSRFRRNRRPPRCDDYSRALCRPRSAFAFGRKRSRPSTRAKTTRRAAARACTR